MKSFVCFHRNPSGDGASFVYFAGGPESFFSEAVSQKEKSAEKKETVTDYKPETDEAYFQGQIDTEISTKKTDLNKKMEDINKDIAAIAEDDPDKEAKKQTLEGLKANIQSEIDGLPEYKSKLEEAKNKAVSKIKAAYEKRNEAIQKEAKKYRDSIVLEMEAHEVTERQRHYERNDQGNFEGDDWTLDKVRDRVRSKFHVFQTARLNDDSKVAVGMQMQQHAEGRAVGPSSNWKRKDQLAMMAEAIQTIYEEEGKEAADAMVERLEAQRKKVGGDREQINWFVHDAAFQGGEGSNFEGMSAFKHVNDIMGAPVDKPKAYGHVLGKMYSADRYFAKHGAPEAFKAYQAYVQEKVKDNSFMEQLNADVDDDKIENILSPAQWLKEHGSDENLKEVLENPEQDRQKFLDTLLANVDVPEGAEYRMSLIRAGIEGALWASDDPAEWDGIARQVMTKMMGGGI